MVSNNAVNEFGWNVAQTSKLLTVDKVEQGFLQVAVPASGYTAVFLISHGGGETVKYVQPAGNNPNVVFVSNVETLISLEGIQAVMLIRSDAAATCEYNVLNLWVRKHVEFAGAQRKNMSSVLPYQGPGV